VGALVVDCPVHQLEQFLAELFGVALVAGHIGLRLVGDGPIGLALTAPAQRQEHEKGGGETLHSIANSRLNTTSKLNVFARLRVSMCSAIRRSRAGMPTIFSWALRPSSLSPWRLSIFQ